MKKTITLSLILLFLSNLSAEVMIWEKDKKPTPYQSVKVDNLDVLAKMAKGTRRIKKDNILAIDMPMPAVVGKLETAYYAKKYDAVIKSGNKAIKKFKYLGWGKKIAYYVSLSYLKKGDVKNAEKTVLFAIAYTNRPEPHKIDHEQLLDIVSAKVQLSQGLKAKAKDRLDSISETSSSIKAHLYNTYAEYYLANSEKDLAIQAFLKSALLGAEDSPEQKAAIESVDAIYTENEDLESLKLLQKIKEKN